MRYIVALMALLGISTVGQAADPLALRSFGADRPATIYVFTSPSCPHCAAYHETVWPIVMDEFVQTGQAQVKVVDMPYDAAALRVVTLARCMETEPYDFFMTAIYHRQSDWRYDGKPMDRIAALAEEVGMTADAQKACLATQGISERIMEQRDNLADLYRIRMMPSTVVDVRGNRPVVLTGTDADEIRKEINKALGKK